MVEQRYITTALARLNRWRITVSVSSSSAEASSSTDKQSLTHKTTELISTCHVSSPHCLSTSANEVLIPIPKVLNSGKLKH